MISDKIQKTSRIASEVMMDTLEEYFLATAEKIKDIIKDNYNQVAAQTIVENSQSNLSLYKNLFETRVDNFQYVVKHGTDQIKLVTPGMDTFNFMDLEMVQTAMEGIAGKYVEISESEYDIINKIENKVSPKKKTYLIRETQEVIDISESILKKKLTKFPFSNKPPLHREIFDKADDVVEQNMEGWIEEAVSVGKKRIKNTFEGVS